MTDKPLTITYKGTYIKIVYVRTAKNKMKDFLDRIDLDDYIIIKYSKRFEIVDKEDLINMVNCGYILYKKDYYNLDYIKEWLDVLRDMKAIYLCKPLPPRYVLKLVKNNKQI